MSIPDGGELPPTTLIIFVSGGKVLQGPPRSIDARALKCDDDGISATWVEWFDGKGLAQFQAASLAMSQLLKVRPSGVIAQISVGELHRCLADEPLQIRVVRDCLPENKGHCLIKGIAPEDVAQLMIIAQSTCIVASAKDVPGMVNN